MLFPLIIEQETLQRCNVVKLLLDKLFPISPPGDIQVSNTRRISLGELNKRFDALIPMLKLSEISSKFLKDVIEPKLIELLPSSSDDEMNQIEERDFIDRFLIFLKGSMNFWSMRSTTE